MRPTADRSSAVARIEQRMIVAVVEGRGEARGEVGMAAMDLNHPVLTLSQVSDDKMYTKVVTVLCILNPNEVRRNLLRISE